MKHSLIGIPFETKIFWTWSLNVSISN